MAILLECRFLAVCQRVSVHDFRDECEDILNESAFVDLRGCRGPKLLPLVRSTSSNSIGARRYQKISRVSIFGYLISIGGQLVALQIFNVRFI